MDKTGMKKLKGQKELDEEEIKIAKEVEIEAEEDDSEEDKPVKASDTYNAIVFIGALLIIVGIAVFVYLRFFMPTYVNPYAESYTYNNFEFKKSGALWKTEVQLGNRLVTVPLHYSPREIKEIEIIGTMDPYFGASSPIYITFDPTVPGNKSAVALAAGELSLNLAQGMSKTDIIAACAKNETEACKSRPIVDCGNTDKYVIYLDESNDTLVVLNNNCVVISGRGQDIVRATDRLLLFWYGVMKKDERTVIEATGSR
jgi:hypothetical protein